MPEDTMKDGSTPFITITPGKGFTMSRQEFIELVVGKDNVVVIDPEEEYTEFISFLSLEGKVINCNDSPSQ